MPQYRQLCIVRFDRAGLDWRRGRRGGTILSLLNNYIYGERKLCIYEAVDR